MADLSVNGGGAYALSGDVGLNDIAKWGRLPELEGAKSASVSLAQVASADSAIAVLLLQWVRQLKSSDGQLAVTECPDSVRLLLELYDLEGIVGV